MTSFPYTRAALRRLWLNIREWFAIRRQEREFRHKPWLVDREGVVYKPAKRIVLRGKRS